MADTTRKKATDVNEPTVTKDKNKEDAIDPKQVKSPKPPLPPRPPGLSKIASGKRIRSLSKSPQHQKETHQDEDSSRPGRPPPPSHQTSIKTPINSKEDNTTEVGKMCTSEKSFPTGHNRSSQDRNEHEHVGSQLDAPQVETSSVSEQTQEPTEYNPEHVVTTKKSQPERPKPFIRSPSIATDDKTNTSSKSSTAPPEKPTPKTHKISPPILPKPELPRGGGKSKSNKLLNVFGKQSPPVQPRTPKSKQSLEPDVLKQAQDLVKENDRDRSITSAVKTPSREDTASYSLENSSSEVVSQTTEETINSAPDNVFNEKAESSESSPPTEKHSELEPASQKEIPGTVISPKATDGTVDTEIQPQKLAKPPRPRVPSRKTEDVIDESHDNVTLAEDTVNKSSHTLDSCKGKEGQNENKTEKVASPKPSRPRAPSRDVNEQSYHVMSEEGQNENKTEKVAFPKPSRPRAPIRKIEDVMNESHDNSALAKDTVNKPSHTLEPCEDKEGQNVNKTEKVASPKPSRPRGPIRKTEDVINERHVSVTLTEDTVNKPSRTLEPCEDKELQNENKTEKVASPKPSRPRAPIKKPEDLMNESHDTSTLAEDTVNKPSRTLESYEDKEGQNENKTAKVAFSKPPRPRAPSRKTEEIIDESIDTSTLAEDTVNKPSRTLEPCEDKEIQNENKTEKVASPKPSRPRAPIRKTEDIIDESIDTSTLAEDTVNKSSRTLEPCEDKEIQNENKTEKVASSKPSRPRAPSRKTEEIISGDTSKLPENVQPLDQQSCAASIKSASPKPSSPKPSRPSKPARPPQLSKTTKHTESNVDEEENKSLKHKNVDKPERSFEPKDSSIKNPATTDSHKNKPQRPSKPNISTVISKEPVCDSTNSEQKDEPHQTIPSTKPQRPSKPNLPSDLTKTKETLCDSTNDFQDEELSQTVVSNNLCGPEMTVAQKEARQTNQHDIEPATNHLLKKTGSIKPSRPPKPNETKHENSSLETYTHTTEVSKPRPPRPQAPHHENEISVERVEPMETLPKSQERHHEKQIPLDENQSVNTPVKPKRASVTESHEQDKEAALGGEKQAHAMKENKDSVSDIMGGNFKKCSDSEKTISKLSSSVVKGSDIESEERKVDDVFVAKCEETRSKFSEHSNSFKLARPPPPNRASSATKDELGKKEGRQETSENDKSSDRHSVRFRVSSLSKTEVESFNKKDFLEKLKDKGHTRRKSEEDSSVSQVGPKPSRPHPPLSSKTTGTSSEREEVQVEPLNAQVLGNENKSNRLKNVSESEGNDVSPTNKAASLGIISDTTVSKSDKACKNESEIPPTDLLQNTPKKMKRKAPPVPEENSNKNDEVHHEDLVVKESEGTKCETAKQNVTRGEQQDENSVGETDVKTKSEALTDTEEHESTETIENNNEQQHVDEITIEHRVIDKDNEKCAEASVVEQTETIIDKEEPGVKHVCSGTENISAGIAESSDKNVETQEVCEATQSPSSKSSENQHDGNVEKKEIVNVVQSPKKKKTPPPKPKRTSSLKRDSKLIVHKREEEEGERRTGDRKVSSSDGLNEIVEENDTGKPSEAVVPSTKTVKFNENPVEPKSFSKPVSRSKSFASPGNDRAKETNGEDIPNGAGEGVSRSFSFSAKIMKKYQPQRPSPPTFFVSETKTDDSANPESANPESEETSKDDVIEVDTSASQEDLAESESSQNNDTKHESCLTTDSESEDGKEEGPQKSKTYYISKEILSTERTFVDVMKLVSEDFKEVVAKGNKKFGRAIIPDETLQEIVMNISQIYKFDSEFLKALEDRMATWEKEERIGDIIKRFSPFLKMYKTYIQGYDNAMAVLTEALKKYPQFAEVVREFESSERCHGLTVGMYMLKPIQRIPSYRLLLIDYLKHLSKDSLDHKDVSDALAIVSEVATHINEDMKRVDNFEEVLKIQRNLVGQVEIVKPGRELIKEGLLMKLSRKEMQPRMFYLLTDVLLYTTPVANNQFRLNLSLPLEEIQVELPVSPDFENEFSIISTKKSFILSASTADERDEWLEALRNASDEIRKKKITFHLAKKEKMEALYDAQLQDDDKELGSKAPVWIPDVRVTMCMVCTDDFTVTNRRHHCRACGKVVCGSCSSNSAPLAYLNDETARVCDICYDELTDKKSSKQTAVEAKENGITTESKDSASKVNPVKKSRKNKFFKSKEVPAVEESTISGYLKTRVGKKWQKKWYVVKDNVLYASKASSDPAAQETRPLLGYDVRGPEKMDGDSKKIVFQLIHAGTEPVVLQTDNLKHGEQWVNALRRATILPL